MTISSTTNRVSFTGNGVTTAFSFPYYFLADGDLVVIETVILTGVQTTKTLTTHYTVAGAGVGAGGTVTMLTAPASTVTLTIYRDPARTQTVDLVENDPLPVEDSVEAPLDKLTMIAQRLSDRLDRSLQQPEGDTTAIDRLPAKVARASMYLAFDSDGDPTAVDAAAGGNSVTSTGSTNARMLAERFAEDKYAADWGASTSASAAVNDAAIAAAIAAAAAAGGGRVILPTGTLEVSASVTLGNGTASVDSTVNGISLIGKGSGTGDGFSTGSPTGVTRLKWTGASGGGPMLVIGGPCRNMVAEDIHLDCNSLANIGVSEIHCAYGTFRRVFVRKWRTIAWNLTTRSGVPAGVSHGNSDGVLDNCGCVDPTLSSCNAVLLTSGYSTAGACTYDTTRQMFINGVYVYGGAAGSYGFQFHGADNNLLGNPCIIRSSLASVSTDDILFTQWTGDTSFPKENGGTYVGAFGIGGTSGTSGNMFMPLPRDDAGGAAPTLPSGCFAITYRGQFVGAPGAGNPWRFVTADAANCMVALDKAAGATRGLDYRSSGSQRWQVACNGTAEGGANAGSDLAVHRFSDAGSFLGTPIAINRADGSVTFEIDIKLNGSTPGSIVMAERTAPSAPAANGCTIYAVDNGAGKTQLMAIFNSGAAQQLAIQP